MLEGLYTAAAGMAAQQQRMDALSNDVANVNTNGYKRVRTGFRDLVYSQEGRYAPGIRTGAGAALTQLGRGFQQGALRSTEEPLDLAIQGEGYFQVRRPDGQLALTRDGSFRLDASGQVVTATGGVLVPPLRLPRGVDASDIRIAENGVVTTAAGRQLGRVQLVTVPSPTGLAPAGDSTYLVTAQSGGVQGTNSTLTQGALEGSNVDLADSMVDMMDAQRAFSMGSRAIQTQDKMMEIANGVKA